jgi:hypothetical protein
MVALVPWFTELESKSSKIAFLFLSNTVHYQHSFLKSLSSAHFATHVAPCQTVCASVGRLLQQWFKESAKNKFEGSEQSDCAP